MNRWCAVTGVFCFLVLCNVVYLLRDRRNQLAGILLPRHLPGVAAFHSRQIPAPKAVAASKMSESVDGYSLWLEPPEGSFRDAVSKEMVTLAGQHTGSPRFLPHVTLLGDIRQSQDQVLETAQKLASQLKAYNIRFKDVTRGTFYYQCVFMLAHEDPETMHAAQVARELYGMQTKPHMPHLSLLYADLTDDEKDKVAAESRERMMASGQQLEFTVGSVSVWHTPTDDKSTQSWKKLADFNLQ